jgi:hypothetical protein
MNHSLNKTSQHSPSLDKTLQHSPKASL